MLEKATLFAELEKDALSELELGAVVSLYPKNTYVLSQGDVSNNLYIILEGRVKVFMGNDEGREITLDYLGINEAFGELALIDGYRRSANVITVEKCRIAMLPRQYFIDCLQKNPNIAIAMMEVLSGRIRSLTGQVENLALLDVYGRIARELIRQSEELPDGRRMTKTITHQDLANLVGASREMVTKILLDLKRGGYIDIDNHCIVIKSRLPARW